MENADCALRVGPDGTSQKIDLGDWSKATTWDQSTGGQTQEGVLPNELTGDITSNASLVTNADSGVTMALNYYLYGYCSYAAPPNIRVGCVPEQDLNRLVAISGGTVVSDSYLNLQNSTSVITPILQAEDGSYFGTETWNVVNSYYSSMQAFDLSGNVKWSVPGFTPVMATADGGVVAQSGNQYVTFDQNGVANGMLATMPTQSWIQNTYQLGSIDEVALAPTSYAASFAAMVGGNNSLNGTSVLQSWFPPLQRSNDPEHPGDYEVAYSALAALRAFVPTCQNDCANKMFGPLGNVNDRSPFCRWLNRNALILDGTKSNMPIFLTCTNPLDWIGCAIGYGYPTTDFNLTIKQYFASQHPSKISYTPSPFGFVTFADPFYFEGTCAVTSSTPSDFGQQSVLFHEALHGYYGKFDKDIQDDYGLPEVDSSNITQYIWTNAFQLPGAPTCSR